MPQAKAQAAALMASVDDVEAQFYEALAGADIERLMGVWSDDDEIVCVHPGGPRVIGHAAVRAAFESIFENGAVPVRPQQVRRVDAPGCSIHHVLERVDVRTAEGAQTAWVVATNVYLKTAQGWRLVLHHASPGSAHEAQEIASQASSPPSPTTLH
jgi:ketosteroid isomerase-like protein